MMHGTAASSIEGFAMGTRRDRRFVASSEYLSAPFASSCIYAGGLPVVFTRKQQRRTRIARFLACAGALAVVLVVVFVVL